MATTLSRSTVTVITPSTAWSTSALAEIWRNRELLYFLIWRDIKVRYKQSLLGILWALLQPLGITLVLTVVFSTFLRITPDGGGSYLVFVLSGLIPWFYFSNSLTRSTESVVNNAPLLTKIYFPRILLPTAAVCAGLLDLACSFPILIVVQIASGGGLTPASLMLPLALLIMLATALGVAFWFSSLNVRYRDIRYVVPLLAQIWMYATPVVYPTTYVPERWQQVLSLNPMTHVVGIFRAAVGSGTESTESVLLALGIAAAVLISGALYFWKSEALFADVI